MYTFIRVMHILETKHDGIPELLSEYKFQRSAIRKEIASKPCGNASRSTKALLATTRWVLNGVLAIGISGKHSIQNIHVSV